MIWVSVMDREVCVQISNDLLHPFQMVAVKSISTSHTQQQQLCIILPVASASPEKLLPLQQVSAWGTGRYLLNTYKGVSFVELHCTYVKIPNLPKLARMGVQGELPVKDVSRRLKFLAR